MAEQLSAISAYPYIPGSSSQAFQGIDLVLGAIISFASSSAISNIVAGVILTYTRVFRLNDRIKVGDTTGDVLEDPAPFVLQTSLDDWYVSCEINAYTKEQELMALIYSNLHQNIQEKFDAVGVEIMSPHYYVLRDGNPSMVPSVLGTKGYVSPAFQVNNGSAKS